jgi:hypothetical protein
MKEAQQNLKPRLLDLLERAYQEEVWLVNNLPVDERTEVGTPEHWSVKDMLAHITAWKERATRILVSLREGKPVPDFGNLEQFNARAFEEHRHLRWDEVVSKSAEAYASLCKETAGTPIEVLTAPEASDRPDEPVWDLIVAAGVNHALGHLTQYYLGCGDATYAIKMQEDAAELLLGLDERPGWQGLVHYGLAIYYTAVGKTGDALGALGEAFRLKPALIKRAQGDHRLKAVRGNPEYTSLVHTR